MEQVQNNLETTETEEVEGAECNETLKRVNKMLDEKLQEFTKDLDEKINHIKLVEEENKSLKYDVRKNEIIKMLQEQDVDTRAIDLININSENEVVDAQIKLLRSVIETHLKADRESYFNNNNPQPPWNNPVDRIESDFYHKKITSFEKAVRG